MVAAILDHLGIARVPVYGGSGAAPYVLAFSARHPHRAAACTVVNGAAPLTDDKVLVSPIAGISPDLITEIHQC